ncbi:MAG: ribbon-helix-helix domain-containing protein [Fimbriimonadales bacterium]|nr:ribbon-helix-helix domain-containing protein [Fimbriimonadales bacterium]MDW8052500.1 ribbon-helix-helix domain-containing protein [Armatimonadota bacterium]
MMKRLNFTLDEQTIQLLKQIADQYYHGNKSHAVRAAIEALASQLGHEGWVVAGFVPVSVDTGAKCHTCHRQFRAGETLYRPVFRRGRSHKALPQLPREQWLECSDCAQAIAAEYA